MKTGADWYPRDPQKFLMGCMGLTAKEIAVYQITVDLMYANAGECPNEPKFIAGFIVDMGAASVRRSLESLLKKGKIFISGNGRLSNETVQKLAKTREETKEKRRKSGEKGGKKSADLRRKATDLPSDSKENNNIAEPSGSTDVQPDKTRVDKISKKDTNVSTKNPKSKIPDNWVPSEDNYAYAVLKNIPQSSIKELADEFQAYWYDRNDRDSKKSQRGWSQCWQSHVRRAASRPEYRNVAGGQKTFGYGQGSSIADIAAQRRANGKV